MAEGTVNVSAGFPLEHLLMLLGGERGWGGGHDVTGLAGAGRRTRAVLP